MGATVTLSSTQLTQDISRSDSLIKVDSTVGLVPGIRLFVEQEAMTVVSLAVDPWVNVRRGTDGTATVAHSGGAQVWIARGDQFYSFDPVGRPSVAIPVSPHINVLNGKVWFAMGDASNPGVRWWQVQTVTSDQGALGVRTYSLNPTTST